MSDVRLIAIAAEDDEGLDGQVSGHFGRCPFYTLAEVTDGAVTGVRVEKNPYFDGHRPGVVPKYIESLKANVILAGGMGPRAVDMFHQFGIEVATGAIGRVGAVLQAYLDGRVKGAAPCNHDHPDSCGGH